ncbi:MAG: hypothetical protein GX434_08345 [Peptococcaceae bacterium]|nr:hypothetical protein [Peptococcaceae bacterium]
MTLAVLSIYTNMFAASYGDWFNQPVIYRGTVESIHDKKENILLTVKNGDEEITVLADETILKNIREKDLIEVAYLPGKNQVFRCTLLTRQAEGNI